VSFFPTFVSNGRVLPAWIWGLSLSVPIETAGKRRLRLVQARYLSEAARINLATVAWQVRSRLLTSLFSLYAAKHTETVLTRQISVQEELVRILEHRLAWGEVPQPEVTLAHIALTQNRLALRFEYNDLPPTQVEVPANCR
jgi:outer membrane protein, heavy metal efflux system